jgi:hypothetical protein
LEERSKTDPLDHEAPADAETSGELKPKSAVRRLLFGSTIKAGLYVVFLAFAVGLLLYCVEELARFMLKRSYLGTVYPSREGMMLKDYIRPTSHYEYDFVPGVCLEYNISKGNRYEYANNVGFRDPRFIPEEKPADEFRIFLTGGSTAYGMGAIGEPAIANGFYSIEFRETIAHMMEKILNTTAPIPGKTIRVYNASVWGYSYQHLLMRYVVKLSRYKPDLIVSLDGANEIPMISKLTPDWNYFEEGQFHNIFKDIDAYNGAGLSSYLTLWLKNNTFMMTYLSQGKDLFQDFNRSGRHRNGGEEAPLNVFSAASLSEEEKSKRADRNVAAVARVVENYHSALQNDGVNHIFALQPWYYLSKKPKHQREKIIDSLDDHKQYYGMPSDKMYALLIKELMKSAEKNGYFLVDFSAYFDDVSECVFTDWCHLTPGANYVLAKELSNLIKEYVLKQPFSPVDGCDDKNTLFWDLAVSAKAARAPEPETPENFIKNMLRGYPSENLYLSKTVPEGEPLEVVLDLEKEYSVSRMRMVWGDKESVPAKWTVEYSLDGENWKKFVEGIDKITDEYSRWPGYEHYATELVTARYFRYRPESTGKRNIKLRQWSLYR